MTKSQRYNNIKALLFLKTRVIKFKLNWLSLFKFILFIGNETIRVLVNGIYIFLQFFLIADNYNGLKAGI